MFQKIKGGINLARNMGSRYVGFRVKHEVLRRSGLLKSKFPSNPELKSYMTLDQWRKDGGQFFFENKESICFSKNPSERLKENFDNYTKGNFLFFNSQYFSLGKNYDWVTNPDSGFKYDVNTHWTSIQDYNKESGDIKYVWEKSRFSFLFDLIRYDYHFNEDCSGFVFKEILSWIKANPVNCGPNYRCSQEISLRVLNWTFALYYYKNSANLTDEIFDQIQYAIYWQVHHVYHNIDFSRIAVRNNHAITETLTLYLISILFPCVEDFIYWGKKGKKWFEEEICYQVYEDGTFLQFSMNYHRVVIQLLTWGIRLSEINEKNFSPVVYDRAEKSLKFLRVCMNDITGWLPNYGSNDGALFFKLNNADYRDYRCQLNALAKVLEIDIQIQSDTEDEHWYGLTERLPKKVLDLKTGVYSFTKGGYFIIRQKDSLTFIRCGNHKDRPAHADNLHLDVWYKGENVLHDAGSYKYNTESKVIKYFSGTQSHNTVMLDDFDQMKKGPRFIWYHWTQSAKALVTETEDAYFFEGTINAFTYLNKDIKHNRKILIFKRNALWEVEDRIINKPAELKMRLLWHTNKPERLYFKVKTKDGKSIEAINQKGYFSSYYGRKEDCAEIIYSSFENYLKTTIEIKE